MYSTIYLEKTAMPLTDGVQSQKICGATIKTARQLARKFGAVVVEDRGTREFYRITRNGFRQKAPKYWIPEWEATEEVC